MAKCTVLRVPAGTLAGAESTVLVERRVRTAKCTPLRVAPLPRDLDSPSFFFKVLLSFFEFATLLSFKFAAFLCVLFIFSAF